MKRLLSIATLLIAMIFTSCSSDSSITVKTYFGKWEADTVTFTDGTTKKYVELGTFERNETLEVFTDQHESAKLEQYYTDSLKPLVQLGSVNDDYIVLEKLQDKRRIQRVEQKTLHLVTQLMIDNKLQTVQVNYIRIGDPRDEEPKK
ncbi:hypothetical protein HX052_11620 [Myroides marinus]|uniref:Lipocalin-like domain-containing protein n=2 Tax=Myroides marinus TaxID=703342 RepID=A0A161S966_9FLAO|nr:hypothetical protein [Myroides marinus]KUF43120.1 hypothetical protein AS361_00290 [Myroides marinus]KZE81994.1 hypothetical protein AV926_07645 [Myroides marinus]MDM1363173.1 hypothetical protein [Myroides marinus]MDM1373097.1 hypothetical protein [Myroides marinus]MDM1376459.1 hypothetical protein [Myroides marinus]